MNTLRQIGVVFWKELRDGARDKRSIRAMLLGAVISPVLLGFLLTTMANRQRDSQTLTIPVAGAERAPALADWLQQQTGIRIKTAPKDPVVAIRERKEDVIVLIGDDYAKQMSRGAPAEVKIVADLTRDESRPKVDRVRRLLAAYSGQMASLRLIARGVSPTVAQPLDIEELEVSSAQQRLARVLVFLPFLLVITCLTGGLQVAIDSTAGERERGSLEPLLLSPVPRIVLTTGKWLASVAFAWASVVFSMLLTVNVMRRVPWHDMQIRFRVTDNELLSMLALLLPLAMMLSALVLFTSTFARSFKEAQGHLGVLMLLPMLPGMVSMAYPLSDKPWLAPIPVLGQYALMADVLAGKPPGIAFYALAGASAIAIAAALLIASAKLLERERVVFGR